MSCTARNSQVSRQGGSKSGITQLSSQMAYTIGWVLAQATETLDRAGQASAPVTNLALKVVEPTGPQAGKQRAALGRFVGLVISLAARAGQMTPLLAKAKLAAQVSELTTGAIGTALADLTETGQAGVVMTEQRHLLFFKARTSSPLRSSRLTGWLNRQDVIGRREITAGDGVVFTLGRTSWHRGTTTFKVGSTQQTITNLQSLSFPQEQYYFDRPISNEQAVGVASGQIKAETVPGFVGRVSKLESCTTWGPVNRALILARLHWGRSDE